MAASTSGPMRTGSGVRSAFSGGVLRAWLETPAVGDREAHQFAKEINEAIQSWGRRVKSLVIDVSEVRSMTSLGLGVIVNARNAAAEHGASTYVLGATRELADLFRMMRIDRLCTLVLDEPELKKVLAGRR
ncbi:MAG TPA: STAS domain-containing protein [Phycisphaerales bacterium]|nr:STAS domain-containing protein [Phycisphaerales bacterium]